MTRHRLFRRIRTAMVGLALTIALWGILALLVVWGDATWPHRTVNPATCFVPHAFPPVFDPARCQTLGRSDQWQTLILLGIIVEFLWLKSFMMGALTTRWDTLGSSLIAANLAFSVVYLLAMASLLYPGWSWGVTAREAIRDGLVLILGWSILQLLLVPDPEEQAPDRRDGEIAVLRAELAWSREEARLLRLRVGEPPETGGMGVA